MWVSVGRPGQSMGPLAVFIPSARMGFGSPFPVEGNALSLDTQREGLGPAPNDVSDFDDPPWEASPWGVVGWGLLGVTGR